MGRYTERQLAHYLRLITEDFEKDLNTTKFLRRVHIKEVHLHRRCGRATVLEKMRRLL